MLSRLQPVRGVHRRLQRIVREEATEEEPQGNADDAHEEEGGDEEEDEGNCVRVITIFVTTMVFSGRRGMIARIIVVRLQDRGLQYRCTAQDAVGQQQEEEEAK